MANEFDVVRMATARAVASFELPDEAVDRIAKQLAGAEPQIRGLSVCERGICIDYIVDGDKLGETLPGLLGPKGGRLQGIEIFPWGIIDPDILHIQVTQEFDELSQLRR